MNVWLELVLSLPTENATARMRAWRALKSSGAAVLRDGVYLLPQRDACRALLEGVASDVRAAGGAAYLLRVSGDGDGTDADHGVELNFVALFDRSADYAAVLADIASARDGLNATTALDTVKQRLAKKEAASPNSASRLPARTGLPPTRSASKAILRSSSGTGGVTFAPVTALRNSVSAMTWQTAR